MPGPTAAKTDTTPTSQEKGEHYDLLKGRIADCYMNATVQRQKALHDHQLDIPAWYLKARSLRNGANEDFCSAMKSSALYADTRAR